MPNMDISHFRVRTQIAIMLGVLVVGMLVFGAWSFRTLGQVEVNGPIYRDIVRGKDLVADVLPPPATLSSPIWWCCSWPIRNRLPSASP